MILSIEEDVGRWKQIVRGRIRRDLKRFMSSGEIVGRKGKDTVSIPLPSVQLPRFRFGNNDQGVGQGEPGDGQGEGGRGQAGDNAAEHAIEVEVTLEELAAIMGEELALPRIEPKGHKNVVSKRDRYSRISTVGPESLRHFRRTYREALQRQIGAGTYAPDAPKVVPISHDKRYRSRKEDKKPERNAVVLYMMDVSGSMGEAQKEIVRMEAFWIDTWLASQYDGVETRFIIHDAAAKEVDRETFFHTKESGGTLISTAYKLCLRILEEDYPASEWNVYPFHFSDGDNWSAADTKECVRLLREELLPRVNVFCYGQVTSEYGSGQFIHDLSRDFPADERVIVSKIENKEMIRDSIVTFLGKGR